MRNLRSTSKLAPLTPEPSSTPDANPSISPDLRVEEIIFKAYLFEKDRADAATRLYHDAVKKCRKEQDRFTRYRAKGLARGIAKKLTPNHDPKAAQ
jgi:hypothetical protein